MGKSPYQSPTDMGVNMIGSCIMDEDACCSASLQEIVRRYYKALCDRRRGVGTDETVFKLELLMKQAGITAEIRPVIAAAEAADEETGLPAVAIELPNGQIVIGGTSELMGPSAAGLLNALKALSGIPRHYHVISRSALEPIQKLKIQRLGSRNPRLHSDEILIALAISASFNDMAVPAIEQLGTLKGCEAHSTVILSGPDADVYNRLGLRVTCTPKYQTKALYHK
jgi:uncharacterized protein (UPF0371 family)